MRACATACRLSCCQTAQGPRLVQRCGPVFRRPRRAPSDRRVGTGSHGANRTGRPFTGDYAGDLLYATLLEFGFATGHYQARPDDGLRLVDCIISNSVRCVPPQKQADSGGDRHVQRLFACAHRRTAQCFRDVGAWTHRSRQRVDDPRFAQIRVSLRTRREARAASGPAPLR